MLCFVLVLSFVSCSNSRVDEKKQIYIGVTCYDQKDTFIAELMDAFKKECARLARRTFPPFLPEAHCRIQGTHGHYKDRAYGCIRALQVAVQSDCYRFCRLSDERPAAGTSEEGLPTTSATATTSWTATRSPSTTWSSSTITRLPRSLLPTARATPWS